MLIILYSFLNKTGCQFEARAVNLVFSYKERRGLHHGYKKIWKGQGKIFLPNGKGFSLNMTAHSGHPRNNLWNLTTKDTKTAISKTSFKSPGYVKNFL